MRAETRDVGDEIIRAVKAYVAEALAPLVERVSTVEEHWRARAAPEKGEKGDPGADGKDVDVQAIVDLVVAVAAPAVKATIAEHVEKAIAALPAPLPGKDGAPGNDGKDADPEVMREIIRSLVMEAVAKLPAPKDGKDGRDGKDADMAALGETLRIKVENAVGALPPPKDGKDGAPGKDIDTEAVRVAIESLVEKAVSRLPTPKDGKDGRDGRDGKDAREPKDGQDGEPGRDALQIVPLVGIDTTKSYPRGTWANYRGGTFFTVRASDPFAEPVAEQTLSNAGWAVAFDGIYDEIEEYQDEGRRIEKTTVWSSGRTKKTTRVGRSVLYRGVYRPDVEYRCGDQVTWGGSQWHCQAEATKERPGGGSPDWVLSVKQGDPGKAAKIEASDKPAGTIKLR